MASSVGPRAGRIDVLGVGVDPITVDELHAEIARLVRDERLGLVFNVNAHCLNLCYEDSALRDSLNGADLSAGTLQDLEPLIVYGRTAQEGVWPDASSLL